MKSSGPLTAWVFLTTAAISGGPAPVEGSQGKAPDPDAARGAATFKTYCVLCHGVEADGMGVAAKVYNPRPANLRISPYSDEYKENIIRRGGEAMGRSPSMPPWGQALSDEQIKDLVAYLRTIRVESP